MHMPELLSLFPLQSNNQLNSKTTDRLFGIFEQIHDHIYANDGLSSQQVFSEILKILFIKIFDEKNNKEISFFISNHEYDDTIDGHKNTVFTKRIFDLSMQAFSYFSDVFKKNEEIELKTSSLAYAISKLQNINLSDSSRDVKGVAFQKFVHSTQRAERGQFFTPEQIIRLCVQIIKPNKNEKVLDPTCGSGGFLSEAMKYVYSHSLKSASEKERKEYVKNYLFGVEINSMVAKMAKMRMLLEGDGFSNIINADSLSNWENLDEEFNKVIGALNQYENYFDIILTNPPFGSQGKITNKSILQRYDLAYKWVEDERKSTTLLNGQVPDILFIERCLDFLKEGGRLAIVLPNGDLENSSLKYLRNYIKNIADILAIVDLPSDTFIPFGTGVKTSILFLQKKGKDNLAKNKVFFGKVNRLGYDGNKNATAIYKKDGNGKNLKDENSELIVDEDISSLVKSYDVFMENNFIENDNAFVIDQSQITDRFDLDFYRPSSSLLGDKLKNMGAKSLGDLVEIIKEKSKKLKEKNLIVQYVELADINTDYLEISNATSIAVHELPSRASYEIKEGDIITAVAGNSIGSKKHMSALVSEKYSEAICTNGFRILRPINIDPYYLLYYLKSDLFLQQVNRFRTGAAIPSISDSDLQKILIPLLSKENQDKIAHNIKESIKLRNKARELLENTGALLKDILS